VFTITSRKTIAFGVLLTCIGLGFTNVLAATLGLVFGAIGVIWDAFEEHSYD
jgi:hypothetical protein